MNNFEKELMGLIQDILHNIAYREYDNMYSSRSYNEEIYNHECALSSLLLLAEKCNIDTSNMSANHCECVVCINDYKNYEDKRMWW